MEDVITTGMAALEFPQRKRPGRPMKIGKIVIDKNKGTLGVNAGPCPECHTPHILTREQAQEFARMFVREQKSWFMRLVDHLRKIRGI